MFLIGLSYFCFKISCTKKNLRFAYSKRRIILFTVFVVVVLNLGHTNLVLCLIVSADGTEIFSGSSDKTVRCWSVQTGQCLQVYQGHTHWVWCVALLPNGNVLSGSLDNSIKVWDRLTGACLSTLTGHTSSVYGITVCPNGDVVSASSDSSLRVWRVGKTPNVSYVCHQVLANAHSDEVLCVTTVPGTDDLISGGSSGDPTVKLWHRANPSVDYKCVRTFSGHTDSVWSVAVMENQNIVSGSWDKTIKIWSQSTGECLHTLSGHTGDVNSVAVLPTNEIVSASDDKTLNIWH